MYVEVVHAVFVWVSTCVGVCARRACVYWCVHIVCVVCVVCGRCARVCVHMCEGVCTPCGMCACV